MQRIRTLTPSTFLRNYVPSNISLWKLCPLNISKTLKNIFMNPGNNIKHYQRTCRKQKPLHHLHFNGIMPLRKFHNGNRVHTITPKPFEIYSLNLVQYKVLSENKNHNPTYIYGIMSLEKYYYGNRVCLKTLKPIEIF